MNHSKEFIQYQVKRQTFWDKVHENGRPAMSRYYQATLARIYQNVIPAGSTVLEVGCADGSLLNALSPQLGIGVDFSERSISQGRTKFPHLTFVQMDAHQLKLTPQTFDYIILSELINDLWDVQTVLELIQPYCSSKTRIVFNYVSHLWNLPLRFARSTNLAQPNLAQNWLTKTDLDNLLEISGYESLKTWREIIIPIHLPWLSKFCNRYLAKIWPFELFDTTNFAVARLQPQKVKSPSVSIIVAARNEAGHISELLERIPTMGSHTEIIFVEGNSHDDTFAVIEDEIKKNPHRDCKLLKQTGGGKGNAVREGFQIASGDILMILDADITVPPEDLPRFYDVLVNGYGDFANGVRLVYPMEEEAMRFFNLLGNKFFSWAFSWLLGQPIRDTLCGTKVLWKSDYKKIALNRSYFGDFDPFGDFDLLFGAARLNLKIEEVPIRYGARKYGETNISRWKHGWLLLKMVMFAAKRIKFIT